MRMLLLSLVAFLGLLHADVAGTFAGTWASGSNGNNGTLQVTFTAGADGAWTAAASFTHGSQQVKTNPVSVKIEGDQVEVVFAYDFGDAKLHSILKGTLTGDIIKGKYVSQAADGQAVDEGAWQAARK